MSTHQAVFNSKPCSFSTSYYWYAFLPETEIYKIWVNF